MKFILLIFAFFYDVAGFLVKYNGNTNVNVESKFCNNCKYFIPKPENVNITEPDFPITLFNSFNKNVDDVNFLFDDNYNDANYYGKCVKFENVYFIEEDVEIWDSLFAIHCRLNNNLCGKEGKCFKHK